MLVPNNDHWLVGVLIGVATTFATYYLATSANEWIEAWLNKPFAFQDRTVAILSVALNIFPMEYLRRAYRHKSLQGLMFFVMGLAVAWFFKYGQDLLNAQ